MQSRIILLALWLIAGWASTADADIYRWDDQQLIPGTEGIEAGPGVRLDHLNLAYAQLVGFPVLDLSGASFEGSDLTKARFYVCGGRCAGAVLANANMTDAKIQGAIFGLVGFTKEQLYSTASYKAKNLQGIGLAQNDLTDWDFSGQNLVNANFTLSKLTNANLTGAVVKGTILEETTSLGFTKEQLYSTRSYAAKDLRRIQLASNDLAGWDFRGQDISEAWLVSANLTHVDFTGANLTSVNFISSTLTNANLIGTEVTGTILAGTTSGGFTKEQLYSTASYQAKNLKGIQLQYNDLSGWDFQGQNLANAVLSNSTLINANLSGANLKSASLREAIGVEEALFSADSVYNQWTVFPSAFDPAAVGLTLSVSPPGDLIADDLLDAADIDVLARRFIGGEWLGNSLLDDAAFDVNADGIVDLEDPRFWVTHLKHTWFGDANLDGEFNSADLVQVLSFGKYEATEFDEYGDMIDPAGWASGDWNTDGEFNTADLIVALADGGYEAGPRPAAVPEPSALSAVLVGSFAVAVVSRSRRKPA